jgi:dihydrofolate reductase
VQTGEEEAVMRIVISEFLTLDGVMQAPGGSEEDRSEGFEHGGWQLDNGYFGDVEGQVVTEAFESSDGMLLGRRTYDIFAGYWPTSTEEPIAGQMNAMKKYVASTTLKEPLEWENSMLLHGDVVEAARKLQEEPGRDLQVIGSGNFAQTLMNNGLVDEYRLMIHPIVLGSGRRLFNEGHEPFQLTLLECKTSTTGVVILSYRPS